MRAARPLPPSQGSLRVANLNIRNRSPAAPRPGAVASDLLLWAETCGIENLKARAAVADTIAKEAATTLTILLAGLGGALAYAVKIFSASPDLLSYGSTALCGYLVFLGALLIRHCLLLSAIPAIYNEPDNLVRPGFTLDQVRRVELRNIQTRIKETVARNNRVAKHLNAIRLAALATPFVFVVGACVGLVLAPPRPNPEVGFELQCMFVPTASAPTPTITCKPKT